MCILFHRPNKKDPFVINKGIFFILFRYRMLRLLSVEEQY